MTGATPAPGAQGLSARRFLTYVVVGVAGFIVDFGLLLFFREIVGSPVWLAGTIAFWGSLAVVFLSNKYVTFAAQGPGHRQLVRYFVLLGFNYVVTIGVLYLAERTGIGYQIGKIVSVAMTTVWNYFAYQLWVFRTSEPARIGPSTTA